MQLKVGKIGMFEFHRADELIRLGREAVRKAAPEIAMGEAEPARMDAAGARRLGGPGIQAVAYIRAEPGVRCRSALTCRWTTIADRNDACQASASTTGT